jgi:putative nucleotidyltransferase with HDIG domain
MAQIARYLPRAARALSLPRSRIRWKILVPYAVLSFVLALAGTYLVTRIVAGSFEERFQNQLAEAARVASDSLVRREREQLATLRAVAFTSGMAEAIEQRDSAALERLVLPVAVNQGAQIVEVVDASGARLYVVTRAPGATLEYVSSTAVAERAAWTPVSLALQPSDGSRADKYSALLPVDGVTALLTAGPVRLDNVTVGAVIVASPLAAVLPAVKSEALADVSVFGADGRSLASTFAAGDVADAPPQPGADGSIVERELFGRSFAFLSNTLHIGGMPAGAFTVALPTSFIGHANALTRQQLAVLFSIGTVAILLTGWLLARAITQPLLRLAQTAQAVANGDLTVRSGVRGTDEIGALAKTFDAMTERVQRQHLGTIGALVSAIDARDPYTRGHSMRVGHLSREIGNSLGLPELEVQHLLVGGFLHDVGKIGVRDAVLLKPGALSPAERQLIEQHPRIGADILATVELPEEVRAIVHGHHERLDGKGYPLQLTASELTIFPRIASVADVYDALVTDRPYRPGVAVSEALRVLRGEGLAGSLDMDVVAAMERLAPYWEQRRHDDPVLQGFDLEGRVDGALSPSLFSMDARTVYPIAHATADGARHAH